MKGIYRHESNVYAEYAIKKGTVESCKTMQKTKSN